MLVTVIEYAKGYTARLVHVSTIEDRKKIKIISTKSVDCDEEVKPPYANMSFYLSSTVEDVSIKGFLESKGYILDKSINVWVNRTPKPIVKILNAFRKKKRKNRVS